MEATQVIEAEHKYVVQTYIRPELVFTHGEGVYLFDSDGNRYLDFMSGIAVAALGHADPEWVAAVRDQAGKLTHISNLFHTAPHAELARRLVENSFADRVFFCNSGSEANETALKFARKYAKKRTGTRQREDENNLESPSPRGEPSAEPSDQQKTKIVAFSGSFHGRTTGALAATARAQYREPFAPLLPGVDFAPFNDAEAAAGAIDENTCAVIVEPVQGEGGVYPATPAFLKALRELCDAHDALLIFDEVQCGLGRTGTLWAYEPYGVTPNIMTLAKPLAGGLPIGATLVTEAVAQAIEPGDHGSTFAAGPLVCRAAQVVFDRIRQPEFLAEVRAKSIYLQGCLADLDAAPVKEVRGAGLLLGVELDRPVKPLLRAARQRGLLVINAGDTVLRLCPPLTVERRHVDEAVEILAQALADVEEAE